MANSSYMNLPSPPTPMMYPGTFIPQPYMMPIPMGMTPMQNNQLRPQQYMYSQGNFKSGFGKKEIIILIVQIMEEIKLKKKKWNLIMNLLIN